MPRMFKLLNKGLFAGLIAGGLAGCAVPLVPIYPQVLYEEVRSNYLAADVSVFAGAGGPTEIYGAPAGGAGPDEIAAAIRLPNYLASRTVTAVPPNDPNGGIRLLLMINPSSVTADDACRGGAKGGTAREQLVVKGVFCRGRRAVSEATVFTKGSPTASDPAFGNAMSALFSRMLPPVSPVDRDGADRGPLVTP